MDSFSILAGVRVSNETTKEVGSETLIQKMVDYSVSHAGFVNISRLRIVYFESMIGAVSIGFGFESFMELNKVIHQVQFKDLDVRFPSLTSFEALPSQEEVVEGNDNIISIRKLFQF